MKILLKSPTCHDELVSIRPSKATITLQEIDISHLGKRKIIFKYALSGGYVNSLEGKKNIHSSNLRVPKCDRRYLSWFNLGRYTSGDHFWPYGP